MGFRHVVFFDKVVVDPSFESIDKLVSASN